MLSGATLLLSEYLAMRFNPLFRRLVSLVLFKEQGKPISFDWQGA